jgi:Zn-dependent protease
MCPSCGGLVYAHQLNQLSAEAQRQEAVNPMAAAQLWQQTLPMLPADSQQYHAVRERIGWLLSRMGMPVVGEMTAPVQQPQPQTQAMRAPSDWRIALAKTAVSMLISIVIYAVVFGPNRGYPFITGLMFSTGLMVLILVHEMGHVLAMRYYRLRAGPPIFIPFLGAVINLLDRPKDALQEAVVGIAGPITGTLGALVCLFWYERTHSDLALLLSYLGFLLNLFNLLPVPPLDGGRVTAAVSPWIWLPGLLFVPIWLMYDWIVNHQFNFILVLLMLFAWPRIRQTLLAAGRNSPYYDIPRSAKRAVGIAYALLALTLIALFWYTSAIAPPMMGWAK